MKRSEWMKVLLSCVAAIVLCVPAFGQVTNGNFSTGDLSGWNIFTTSNGTANAGVSPDIQSFDVTGSGVSLAARFNVGQVQPGINYEGGGIYQDIIFGSTGLASFSVD